MGSEAPIIATEVDSVDNGDFQITASFDSPIGDGIDETTRWDFDFTHLGLDDLADVTLQSAILTLTITPQNNLISTDTVKIEGLGDINFSNVEGVTVGEQTTLSLNLLETYSSEQILTALRNDTPGKLPMSYEDDAIVSYAKLDLHTEDAFTIKSTHITTDLAPKFTAISLPIPEIGETDNWQGTSSWGDVDNDGDLDALVTGQDEQGKGFAHIYLNQGDDTFTNGIEIEGLERIESTVWGDYNNDGQIDLLLAGYDTVLSPEGVAIGRDHAVRVYRNISRSQQVGFNTNQLGFSVESIFKSSNNESSDSISLSNIESNVDLPAMDWKDYDNDGDLDILVTGKVAGGAALYRNQLGEDGTRVYQQERLEALVNISLTNGTIESVDYDNDGDIDFLLTGKNSETPFAKLYQNIGNWQFQAVETDFLALYDSDAAWGDYNNDGYFDLLLTGQDASGQLRSALYRSDGEQFTVESMLNFAGVTAPSIDWADYDNDRDLDILLTGKRDAQPVTEILENDNGSFTPLADDTFLMTSIKNGEAAWGDYDDDGDLDILMSGGAGRDGVPFAQIYRSNLVEREGFDKANQAPTPPDKTDVIYSAYNADNQAITFEWKTDTGQADPETPIKSLSYNLRVGTSPGASDILAPLSLRNGKTTVSRLGNVGFGDTQFDAESLSTINSQWTLNGLEPGQIYYWNVQAIDQGNKGSGFDATLDDDASFAINFVDWNSPLESGAETLSEINTSDIEFDGTITSKDWGDYNNDGLRDLLITGETREGSVLQIYKGNRDNRLDFVDGILSQRSSFSVFVLNRRDIQFKDAKWGDYNNDGYQDILFAGGTSRPEDELNVSGIYQNTEGSINFEERVINLGRPSDVFELVHWGDADNDGFLDVIMAGTLGAKVYYLNDGQLTENPEEFAFQDPEELKEVNWVDYDNDGDLDLTFSLEYNNGQATEFFSNDLFEIINDNGERQPDISFVEVATPDREGSVVDIGDYNNSGALDFLVEKDVVENGNRITVQEAYRNIIERENALPSAPTELLAETYGTNVVLNWEPGTDPETCFNGLRYNLRVGTWDTETNDIVWNVVAPETLANLNQAALTGGKADERGFISKQLRDLKDGVYYWQVQTVDPTFSGSEWSDTRSFVIGNEALDVSESPQQGDQPEASIRLDQPRVNLVQTSNNAYTVSLNRQPSDNVVIEMVASPVPGTANSGNESQPAVDLAATTGQVDENGRLRLTFTPDNWNTAQAVTFTPSSAVDTSDTGEEISLSTITHRVATTSAAEYQTVPFAGEVAVWLDNTDSGLQVQSAVTNTPQGLISEAEDTAYFIVELDRPSPEPIEIAYQVVSGDGSALDTAVEIPAEQTIRFGAWDTQAVVAINLVNDEDVEREADQTVWLLLEDNEKVFIKDFQAATTIVDDYTPPLPEFAVTDFSVPDTVTFGEPFTVSGAIADTKGVYGTITDERGDGRERTLFIDPYYEIYLADSDGNISELPLATGQATVESLEEKTFSFTQDITLSAEAENQLVAENYSLVLQVGLNPLELATAGIPQPQSDESDASGLQITDDEQVAVTVNPQPQKVDLAVAISHTNFEDDQLRVDWTISNAGDADSPVLASWIGDIYLSQDAQLDLTDVQGGDNTTTVGEFLADTTQINQELLLTSENAIFSHSQSANIAPGDTVELTAFFTLPPEVLTAGYQYAHVLAFPDRQIEADANNNADSLLIASLPSNLDVGQPTFYVGSENNDLLTSGNIDSVLAGASGADTLNGGAGSDELSGGSGDDVLNGGPSSDTLNGGAGNDELIGGGGDDVLNGGLNSDILNGGAGSDRFIYNTLGDAGDTITDFTPGTDLIDLSGLLNSLGYAGDAPIDDGIVGFSSQGNTTQILVISTDSTGEIQQTVLANVQSVVGEGIDITDASNFVI